MTDDALENLNTAIADIWKNMKSEMKAEAKFDEIVRKMMDEGEVPIILYKYQNRHGRKGWWRYGPILSRYIRYQKQRTRHWTNSITGKKGSDKVPKGIEIYNTLYREGDIKVMNSRLIKKVNEIDAQIKELENQRENLFKANYSRLKPLTYTRMQRWDKVRRELLKKLGLVKE